MTGSTERIVIIGAGAMGSLIAARLVQAGSDIVLYGRPSDHLSRLQSDGLTAIELDGQSHHVPVSVSTDPAIVADARLVIVVVKTWATAAALAPLQPHLAPDTALLTLQNGLGNPEAIRAAIAPAAPPVLIGITTQAALRPAPGIVQHTGAGPTAIGQEDGGSGSCLTETVRRFEAAGLPAVAVSDIERWIWRKLAINAAINPITALARVPNGTIADDLELRTAAILLAREVAEVAQARGLVLNDIEAAMLDVARQTAANHSSMLQDLEQGTRTEIDAINGAVVAEAMRHEIAVPANQLITALVRARERAGGAMSEENETA